MWSGSGAHLLGGDGGQGNDHDEEQKLLHGGERSGRNTGIESASRAALSGSARSVSPETAASPGLAVKRGVPGALVSWPMRVSYPLLPAHRQAEARAIARRTHQTFLFAALTGVLVGLV